jgi:hypothetical protein
MLDAKQNEGRVFQPRGPGMFFCVGHARGAIGQEPAEFIARDDNETDVDSPISESRMKVNHIHYKQVAPRRHLHFNTDTNPRTIHNLAFHPVDVSGAI